MVVLRTSEVTPGTIDGFSVESRVIPGKGGNVISPVGTVTVVVVLGVGVVLLVVVVVVSGVVLLVVVVAGVVDKVVDLVVVGTLAGLVGRGTATVVVLVGWLTGAGLLVG